MIRKNYSFDVMGEYCNYFERNKFSTYGIWYELLERFLLKNKFSLEKTKTKIENYCTLRARYLNYFEDSTDYVPSRESVFSTPLIPLTDNLERLIICKVFDEDTFDFTRSIKMVLAMFEVYSRLDYSTGDIIIVDMHGITSVCFRKLKISLLCSVINLGIKAYSSRLKAVHIINSSKFVKLILTLIKPILSIKIFNRIKVHDDIESLHKVFPKRCLPSDYGGELKSLKEIIADFDNFFDDNPKMLLNAMKAISNECLRTYDRPSIRNLQID